MIPKLEEGPLHADPKLPHREGFAIHPAWAPDPERVVSSDGEWYAPTIVDNLKALIIQRDVD